MVVPASLVPSQEANSQARMVFLDREKLKPQNFKAEMCLLPLILVLREAISTLRGLSTLRAWTWYGWDQTWGWCGGLYSFQIETCDNRGGSNQSIIEFCCRHMVAFIT